MTTHRSDLLPLSSAAIIKQVVLPADFPELAGLDLFLSVVKSGSMSKAAEAHLITQPSASSRIKTLERQLGLTLLERSPTGSRPTPEGAVVAGWAESLLRSADALATGAAALRAEAAGLLRIAASYTVAEYLLPPWIESFFRNRPEDSAALEVANSTTVLERLASGAADLGFIESPGPTPNMVTQVVGIDELVTVVAPGHPWARRGTVPVEALVTTPMVSREVGSGTREALDAALAELGYASHDIALDLGSTSAVRAAVISGSSPTVISRLAVVNDLAAGSLVEIDVVDLHIVRQLRAVWPRRRALSPLAKSLLKQLPSLDV